MTVEFNPKITYKMAAMNIDNDIASMYPAMMSSFSKMLRYEVLTEGWNKVCPEGHVAIMVNIEIGNWIEHQPVHMWKYIDLEKDGRTYAIGTHFFVSNELLTWLKLRWGA